MTSRTQLLSFIKDLRHKDVAASVAEQPDLLSYKDERGRNLLHMCCSVNVAKRRLRDADSVKTANVLLQAGLDLNGAAFREGQWRATPLWHAVARGENLTLAKHLLELGCDPNHCLWAAAFRSDLAAIKLLIANGADVDAVTENETPFLSAVKVSHFDSAELLLTHGANVNFQDSGGMSALHYMLKKNSAKEHFRMVIGYGARGDLKNRKGETVASLMSRKRDVELKCFAETLRDGASTARKLGR